MKVYEYGDPAASTVLVQMADDHDLAVLEKEAALIRELSGKAFRLIAVKVNDWNHDLSPWKAPAVFGNESFGDGAEHTLSEVLKLLADIDKTHLPGKDKTNLPGDSRMDVSKNSKMDLSGTERTYYIGGYSLAGLFALWAVHQTDLFAGAAAASPSVWFPGFLDYMKEHEIRTKSVYLSLGDREEKTRNPVMSQVGSCIRSAHTLLEERGLRCTLEWNKGNHFKDPDRRTAKAFAWVMG